MSFPRHLSEQLFRELEESRDGYGTASKGTSGRPSRKPLLLPSGDLSLLCQVALMGLALPSMRPSYDGDFSLLHSRCCKILLLLKGEILKGEILLAA